MQADRHQRSTDTHERILAETTRLLATGGKDAVSTRAVSAAAGVQAPTIYRLFGDKQGLLDAAAAYGLAEYLASKDRREPSGDPVDDLRTGWEEHVDLGLANPALYLLMYGEPRPEPSSPAAVAAYGILAAMIHRIAEAGRLRVGEDRATQLVHAVGHGTTLTLIGTPPERRDRMLSELAREAVISAITTDPAPSAPPGPAQAATTLRAVLPQTTMLSAPERELLTEWLDRIADAPPPAAHPGCS